jgi:shikimate dehydrogenase
LKSHFQLSRRRFAGWERPLSLSKKLAVIGDPVNHSLSPRIHSAAIAAAGLEADYGRVRVAVGELDGFVNQARSGVLDGFNVTIPHKQRICPLLDGLEEGAAKIGAVNTVVRQDHRVMGFNTDVAGFMAALRSISVPMPPTALILGTGGAARAVAWSLMTHRVDVAVSGRHFDLATDMVRDLGGGLPVRWVEREQYARQSGLIVNATPLGMAHLPDQSALRQWPTPLGVAIAFDLVYGHETPFLQAAAAAGWLVVGGLEMLVQQAAESFRLWFGVEPNLDVMRHAGHAGETICSVS